MEVPPVETRGGFVVHALAVPFLPPASGPMAHGDSLVPAGLLPLAATAWRASYLDFPARSCRLKFPQQPSLIGEDPMAVP